MNLNKKKRDVVEFGLIHTEEKVQARGVIQVLYLYLYLYLYSGLGDISHKYQIVSWYLKTFLRYTTCILSYCPSGSRNWKDF